MPATPQQIEQALGAAQLALREGRLADAERHCRDAIALAPDHSESHNALGVVLRRARRHEQAVVEYRQALKINPRNARAQHNLGDALRFLDRIDEAAEACRIALAIDPTMAIAYKTLADCYLRGGRPDLAATTLKQLTALDPSDADASYDWALLEHERQNLPAAIEGYVKALELRPGSLEVMVNLSAAYREAGQFNRALDVIQQALAIDPTFLPARHGWGETIEKLVPPWHIPMMNEAKRNLAYRDAIRAVVEPDDHVLEIGTGAGLLAMMAAEAGAKHVTTCEMVPIVAEEAARIVEKNGFADRVSVVAKRSTSLVVGQDMPDRADVLVSEILSNDFVGEGVVPSFNDAKARLLKPGARVIPARGQIMGALVGGPHIEYLLGLGDVCGFDVSSSR